MEPIIRILLTAVKLYQLCIVIRCILSFVNPYHQLHRNPIVRQLYRITDPMLDAIRNAFPFLATGGIDLSPIALIFLLHFTVNIILNILR